MLRSSAPKPVGDTPEAVLAMLESCDLTEEETETLLTDAYAMNRRLRAELSRLANDTAAQPQPQASQPPQARRSAAAHASSSVTELPPLRNAPMAERLGDARRIYRSATGLAAGSRRSSDGGGRPAALARKEWQ